MYKALEKAKEIVRSDISYTVIEADYYSVTVDGESVASDVPGCRKKNDVNPFDDCIEYLYALPQPGWPAENSSNDYALSNVALSKELKRSLIPHHVFLSEILRGIDCRVTELLFFCGQYPENRWSDYGKQLTYSRKIQLLKQIMPSDLLPEYLIRNVGRIRNEAEHQYAEPGRHEMQQVGDTMTTFFQLTNKLLQVLKEVSVFKFELSENDVVHVQIMRELGKLLIISDGEVPNMEQAIPADDDPALQLIRRILNDIHLNLSQNPHFWSQMGY